MPSPLRRTLSSKFKVLTLTQPRMRSSNFTSSLRGILTRMTYASPASRRRCTSSSGRVSEFFMDVRVMLLYCQLGLPACLARSRTASKSSGVSKA